MWWNIIIYFGMISNKSIQHRDGTLPGTPTSGYSWPGIYGNEYVLQISSISRTGANPSDSVLMLQFLNISYFHKDWLMNMFELQFIQTYA